MGYNETVLEVCNLSKSYESFSLDNVNFHTKKGKITGFIGINGSGKTTTIKSLAGLVIPNSGDIKFFGESINNKNESKLKDRIGFLLDGDYYYPELTMKQMKNIFKATYSNWDEAVFESLIAKFGLKLNQKISELSKGMTIQYLLSLALSHHAEILIMDEPTSGLDPLVRFELMEMLKEQAEQGTSILFSTHITSDLEKITDDVVLIHKGRIVFQEEMKALKEKYFVLKGPKSDLSEAHKKLFMKIKSNGDVFEAIYKGDKEKISNIFPNLKLESASLEDIMLGNIFGDQI